MVHHRSLENEPAILKVPTLEKASSKIEQLASEEQMVEPPKLPTLELPAPVKASSKSADAQTEPIIDFTNDKDEPYIPNDENPS